MRHWLLPLLFQVASTHVLGVRNSGDVTAWRGEHAAGGQGVGYQRLHKTAHKPFPPHVDPTQARTIVATSPPPAYSTSSSPTNMPPAPVPTHSATATAGISNAYRASVLHQHNIHRKNHSSPAIEWDHDLTVIALEIANSCNFAHNVTAGGGGYGQNIAAGTAPQDIAAVITNEFYNNEEPWFNGLYGLASPPMTNFEHWGHFSQVVWANSKTVGCATVHCPNGVKNVGNNVPPYFTVCNYKPPGNFAKQYANNIGKPIGNPTVTIKRKS